VPVSQEKKRAKKSRYLLLSPTDNNFLDSSRHTLLPSGEIYGVIADAAAVTKHKDTLSVTDESENSKGQTSV